MLDMINWLPQWLQHQLISTPNFHKPTHFSEETGQRKY